MCGGSGGRRRRRRCLRLSRSHCRSRGSGGGRGGSLFFCRGLWNGLWSGLTTRLRSGLRLRRRRCLCVWLCFCLCIVCYCVVCLCVSLFADFGGLWQGQHVEAGVLVLAVDDQLEVALHAGVVCAGHDHERPLVRSNLKRDRDVERGLEGRPPDDVLRALDEGPALAVALGDVEADRQEAAARGAALPQHHRHGLRVRRVEEEARVQPPGHVRHVAARVRREPRREGTVDTRGRGHEGEVDAVRLLGEYGDVEVDVDAGRVGARHHAVRLPRLQAHHAVGLLRGAEGRLADEGVLADGQLVVPVGGRLGDVHANALGLGGAGGLEKEEGTGVARSSEAELLVVAPGGSVVEAAARRLSLCFVGKHAGGEGRNGRDLGTGVARDDGQLEGSLLARLVGTRHHSQREGAALDVGGQLGEVGGSNVAGDGVVLAEGSGGDEVRGPRAQPSLALVCEYVESNGYRLRALPACQRPLLESERERDGAGARGGDGDCKLGVRPPRGVLGRASGSLCLGTPLALDRHLLVVGDEHQTDGGWRVGSEPEGGLVAGLEGARQQHCAAGESRQLEAALAAAGEGGLGEEVGRGHDAAAGGRRAECVDGHGVEVVLLLLEEVKCNVCAARARDEELRVGRPAGVVAAAACRLSPPLCSDGGGVELLLVAERPHLEPLRARDSEVCLLAGHVGGRNQDVGQLAGRQLQRHGHGRSLPEGRFGRHFGRRGGHLPACRRQDVEANAVHRAAAALLQAEECASLAAAPQEELPVLPPGGMVQAASCSALYRAPAPVCHSAPALLLLLPSFSTGRGRGRIRRGRALLLHRPCRCRV
mmetsp:Transcript_699/g.2478  ORF Transcript_699/g.2478 Transcript_699/m.2478 type:complete len:820 (+) Transcript_699:324-2783(+)